MERDEDGKLRVAQAIPMKVAEHDESLTYQIQDPDGKVRTYPITEKLTLKDGTPIIQAVAHPHGSRWMRRRVQQHHPMFTKKPTKGREWLK